MRSLYRQMIYNLKDIDKILPDRNMHGTYSRSELARIRSYYILCHAEFEHFFEECATQKINDVMREWNRNNRPHILLISLTFAFIKEDSDVLAAKRAGNMTHLLNTMRAKYQKNVLDKNNGIKQGNLEDIYAPLGIDIYSILDNNTLASLTFLGEKRGDFAHRGLHLNSVEDVSIARQRTGIIIRDLRNFIVKLDRS